MQDISGISFRHFIKQPCRTISHPTRLAIRVAALARTVRPTASFWLIWSCIFSVHADYIDFQDLFRIEC